MTTPETDAALVELSPAVKEAAWMLRKNFAHEFARALESDARDAATRITTLRAQLEAAERERDESRVAIRNYELTMQAIGQSGDGARIAAAEAEVAKLRELVVRAQHCMPLSYINWHETARTLLEGKTA